LLLDIKPFSFGNQCIFYLCTGNQPSLTTNDGGNFQLLSEGPELNDNGILVNLQTEPNPAQLVLDIIRIPMIRRDEGIIIEKSQIFLLDQLTRISPHIDPDIKYEAMKLTLKLKETVNGSAENSLVVLGFLLLLSSYGLFPHFNFNEDEVLKLFEVVAHHKEAVELFRTLGFVDKIYGMFINDVLFRSSDIFFRYHMHTAVYENKYKKYSIDVKKLLFKNLVLEIYNRM